MRCPVILIAAAAAAAALAGCGASGAGHGAVTTPDIGGGLPRAHAHVIEPTAGVLPAGPPATNPGAGDTSAHAPPLSEVKREIKQLDLCGGVSDSADATPIASASGPGFVADPGTQQTEGELPIITADLAALGRALGVTIYGISGYRTPAQSVAVGGYANDPHTIGLAEDIGVNSLLRSSAAQISEAELAKFGLYRPFDPSDDPNNTEVNHLQLIPAGGPLSLAESTELYHEDPLC
jgi:hypothetical protein